MASDQQVGFANVVNADLGGDYHGYALAASSPYKGKASDGKDPGVDFAALDAALSGNNTGNINRCDVNQNSVVNIVDVQLAVNQALGQTACTADVNQDGSCNVVDVQRIANAALGGPCVVSP